jgi:hypothetical protein
MDRAWNCTISIGRFLQIDPETKDQENFSPYHFGANNPIKFADPTGRNPIVAIPIIYAVGEALLWVGVGAGGAALVKGAYDNVKQLPWGHMGSIMLSGISKASPGGMVPPQMVNPVQRVNATSGKTTQPQAGSPAKASAKAPAKAQAKAPANTSGAGGKKPPPNPDGKKGGKPHQDKIEEVAKDMDKRGLQVQREVMVKTPGGNKEKRFIDVQGTNPKTGATEQVQVGKQNKNGTPVSREVKAMDDVQKTTNVRPTFVPYN